jgi:hypothetical protein
MTTEEAMYSNPAVHDRQSDVLESLSFLGYVPVLEVCP